MKNKKIIIQFFVMVFVVLLPHLAMASGSEQITDYSRLCNDNNVLPDYDIASPTSISESQAISECRQWNNLTSTTYVVNADAQTVIEDDNGVLTPASSLPCIVVDSKNWSCGSPSAPEFGYRNGNYFDNYDILPTEHFGYWTYWWYKIIGM